MYNYRTNRVGNLRELESYFLANYNIGQECLVTYEIEHGGISMKIAPITKETDDHTLR